MNTRLNANEQTDNQAFLDETDLQEELIDIFRSISRRIPVDKIHWVQTHYDLQIIRIIAQVSDTGGEKTNFMYDVPGQIVAFLHSDALPEIHIIRSDKNRQYVFNWFNNDQLVILVSHACDLFFLMNILKDTI